LRFLELLAGSVVHRPYVFAFFACFLAFASRQMGWRRTLTFTVSTYLITFACEYSSTRNGFPFGPYTYFDDMRSSELWISNVPFWDSLSFVFLSYFSYAMASAIGAGRAARSTPWLGGVIMMLLDVVIDPVTLQGDKWFLGRIYNYPYEGFYFGVTAANFAGWFFVGFATQWAFQRWLQLLPWCRGKWNATGPRFIWGIYGVYAGVFAFNLAVTILIGDFKLATASAAVSAATLAVLGVALRRRERGALAAEAVA
jgi:putative membrane protein